MKKYKFKKILTKAELIYTSFYFSQKSDSYKDLLITKDENFPIPFKSKLSQAQYSYKNFAIKIISEYNYQMTFVIIFKFLYFYPILFLQKTIWRINTPFLTNQKER